MTTKLLRTLMGMVALVAMLTACSSEDVLLDEPNAKNEITFNVTTNRASRAVQVFNQKEDLSYFRFSAWETGGNPAYNQEYALRDLVKLNGGKWENTGGLRYWPNNGATLDFYAWCCGASDPTKGDHASFIWGNKEYTTGPTLSFTVQESSVDQTDLIYASASGSYSAYSADMGKSQQINLDFHHALSQIVFKLENVSDKLHIEIDKISICNVQNQGTFKFKFKGADATWNIATPEVSHYYTADYKVTEKTTITDEKSGKDKEVETTKIEAIDIELNKEITTFIDDPSLALMLLPIGKFGEAETTENYPTFGNNCPYISIMCKIWNVAEPKATDAKYGWKTTDNLIYGDKTDNELTGYKEIRIPISGEWEMNKRYVYFLTFGKGNAGYTSDGKAVIVPMSYDYDIQGWGNDEVENIQEPAITGNFSDSTDKSEN